MHWGHSLWLCSYIINKTQYIIISGHLYPLIHEIIIFMTDDCVWHAIYLLIHPRDFLFIPYYTFQCLLVCLSDMSKYTCFPLIPHSLSVLYLTCAFFIINSQYIQIPCFNLSVYLILLPFPSVVFIIFQVKYTS